MDESPDHRQQPLVDLLFGFVEQKIRQFGPRYGDQMEEKKRKPLVQGRQRACIGSKRIVFPPEDKVGAMTWKDQN